jgi:hypothetical protein
MPAGKLLHTLPNLSGAASGCSHIESMIYASLILAEK